MSPNVTVLCCAVLCCVVCSELTAAKRQRDEAKASLRGKQSEQESLLRELVNAKVTGEAADHSGGHSEGQIAGPELTGKAADHSGGQ